MPARAGCGQAMTDLIHYGEIWRRLAAGVVDALILAVPIAALAATVPAPPEEAAATVIVFGSGLVMFYRMILEGSSWQATPGKLLLDLRVTNPEGARLLYANTALRGWPFWLPGAMLGVTGELLAPLVLLSVAALAAIPLTARRQGLHDLTARSIVVRRYVTIGRADDEASS